MKINKKKTVAFLLIVGIAASIIWTWLANADNDQINENYNKKWEYNYSNNKMNTWNMYNNKNLDGVINKINPYIDYTLIKTTEDKAFINDLFNKFHNSMNDLRLKLKEWTINEDEFKLQVKNLINEIIKSISPYIKEWKSIELQSLTEKIVNELPIIWKDVNTINIKNNKGWKQLLTNKKISNTDMENKNKDKNKWINNETIKLPKTITDKIDLYIKNLPEATRAESLNKIVEKIDVLIKNTNDSKKIYSYTLLRNYFKQSYSNYYNELDSLVNELFK